MDSKFDELVRSLDAETLEELRRSVAAEAGGRRRRTSMAIDEIRVGMSAEQKERAMRAIARVLEGEDGHA